jgi:hypothetical protein
MADSAAACPAMRSLACHQDHAVVIVDIHSNGAKDFLWVLSLTISSNFNLCSS